MRPLAFLRMGYPYSKGTTMIPPIDLPPEQAHLARISELETALAAARDEVSAWQGRWRDGARDTALSLALQQAGCRDVEAALRLLDRDTLTVDDAGSVPGVTQVVGGLKEARAYLFTVPAAPSGSNPASSAIPTDPTAALATWLRGG